MNVLNKIVEKKKIEVSEDKKKLPLINIKKLIKRNNFFFKKQLNTADRRTMTVKLHVLLKAGWLS